MQKAIKRIYVAFVCTLFIFSLSCFGFSVNAAESTLGTQKPAITAVYTDSNGEQADGGALTSGTYQMVLTVSDLSYLSQFEFTATYDTEVMSIGSYTALPDAPEELVAVGPKISNGNFIFGIMSKNAECTELPGSTLTLLTMEITITTETPVDMDVDVVTVSEDANFTFIEVNYNDRTVTEDGVYTYNCYALSDANFSGTVHDMICDLSPEIPKGYTVSAYVGALTSPTDTVGKYATTGAVVSITTADGTVISATTDDAGKFTLNGVPNGTHTATITYKYGFDREFYIEVNNADVTSTTMVGIVPCDFSKDGTINVSDYLVYAEHVNETSVDADYDLGVDITRDGTTNVSDYMIYSAFVNQTQQSMTYADITVS